MINNLKIQKICYDVITYNSLSLDEEWLKRNDFNKLETKNISHLYFNEIIVTKNDDSTISLKSDDECEIFFNKYK